MPRIRTGAAWLKRRVAEGIVEALGRLRELTPRAREAASLRMRVEQRFDGLARGRAANFAGKVLVDGTFDNPNYWFRYSQLRAGLGLANGEEIGLVGPYRRPYVKATFKRLGIPAVRDLAATPSAVRRADAAADALLAQTHTPDDVMRWQLPEGLDPGIVYDAILKRQRRAKIDVHADDFAPLVREALHRIFRVIEVLDAEKPDLVIVSHTLGLVCGPLAFIAATRGIDVVLAFGLFGTPRFARFFEAQDVFSFYDRPSGAEIDALDGARAQAFGDIGRLYLKHRYGGKADDLASVYAYQKSVVGVERQSVCAAFGWDPAKPIVAVYASNWFDWPHQLGMTQFRDFHDWTTATLDAARETTAFNWLFKPHPAEDWFGGVSLAEVMADLGLPAHVRLSDKSWNNANVLNSVDALVTYHGTAGIEFAALGKPVLVPDRGKYHDCGFVYVAATRKEYLDTLSTRWWSDWDAGKAKSRSEIFAGWWFCAPSWQGSLLTADDSKGQANYEQLDALFRNEATRMAKEIETVAAWWKARHRFYHTWKMACAPSLALSNV